MNGDTLAILVGGGRRGINGSSRRHDRSHQQRPARHRLARRLPAHRARRPTRSNSRSRFAHPLYRRLDLRTSRTDPAGDEETLQRCVRTVTLLGVRYLICIGGDDTTYGATRIAALTRGRIGVATVPKTIDNDLPLPENAPTFGFETARAVGTGIVESLMEDARTTARWYLCVSMGRKSGALALGMCKAASATLAVIGRTRQHRPFEAGGRHRGRRDRETSLDGSGSRRGDHRGGHRGNRSPGAGHARKRAAHAYGTFGGDVDRAIFARHDSQAARQIGVDLSIVNKDVGTSCAARSRCRSTSVRARSGTARSATAARRQRALIALSGGRVTPVDLAICAIRPPAVHPHRRRHH